MVWYSHLFQNFPQFIVIHTVKGFGIVNKAVTILILILEKVDFKLRNVTRNKEGLFMTKGSSYQEDIKCTVFRNAYSTVWKVEKFITESNAYLVYVPAGSLPHPKVPSEKR